MTEELQDNQEKSSTKLEVLNQCKNCGHHLFVNQKFCPSCGAKRIYNRLTVRNLFEDFTERFLNIENVLLKTIINLFKQPEDVIDGYINGLRKRYMSAFGYFAIALTITSFYTFVFRNWFLGSENLGLFSSGFSDGIKIENSDAVLKNINFMFDYQSILSFINIPFYAILSKIVFWNYKKYNFIEHLVIHLYAYSQFQILLSLLGVLFIWSNTVQFMLSGLTVIGPIIYTAYVLYRVFEMTIKNILIKTLFFITIVLPFTCLFFSITGGIAYSFGAFDEIIKNTQDQIEVIKQQKQAVKDSITKDSIRLSVEKIKDTIQAIKTH